MDKPHKLTHLELLETALEEPGMLSTSFNKFYNYSLGNSLGVQIQCLWRGQEPNFFMSRKKWEEIGRSVKEDQKRKALFIWIPTTKKYQRETENPDTGEIEMQSIEYRTFVYRPRVYTLEQTEGKEVELLQPPDFDIYKACDGLDIEIIPFVHSNGNAGGYRPRDKKAIAVNPIWGEEGTHDQLRVFLHEMAHAVLHHEDDQTAPDIKEMEAEGVTYVVGTALELDGLDKSRGYIQHWAGDKKYTDKMARRIFSASEQILKNGREV